MVAVTPSHRVDSLGDRVVIRDLELFVGFDKSIDDPEDKRVKKYDKKAVQAVLDRTQKYIARNQHPKLILGHNASEAESSYVRPVIGDISNLQLVEIGDAVGITGDVEMTNDDFDSYLKTNSFPRRSAEIWPDGFMSEVALLGSETPARPLPDTKFERSSCSSQSVELFSRTYPAIYAEPTETAHDPGPGNTFIPTAGTKKKTKKGYVMAKEDEKTKLAELEDENKKLKAKLAKFEKDDEAETNEKDDDEKKKNQDDDEKDTNTRIRNLQNDVEKFRREAKTSSDRATATSNQLAALSERSVRKDISHELELMARQGFRVGRGEERDELLDRIASAKDPEKELEFWRRRLPQDPVNLTIDQFGSVLDTNASAKTLQEQAEASDRAVKRCTEEKKPQLFHKYLKEELEAA